ncbi:interaptin-like [Microplitis demolitor]|uniref:interaptin-like n=1 Tax=Microplitis demolitor TaxID=69319 RepID=UPI00235B5C2B|nr:interaptin-like [Microplitis demolitor]
MNPSPTESTSFVDSKPENEKLKSQIISLMRNIGYCQSEISYLSCKIEGLNDLLENIEQLGLHRELVNQKLSEETAAANISDLEREIQILKNELQEHQRTKEKSSDTLSADKQHPAVREGNHIEQLELRREEELSEEIAAASISNLEREIEVLKNDSQERQRTSEQFNDNLSDFDEQHSELRREVVNEELSEEISAASISNLESEIQVLKNESQEHQRTSEESHDNLSGSNEQHPALKEDNRIKLELRRGKVVNKELSEEIAAASISNLESEIQILKNESQEQQTNEKSDDNLSDSVKQHLALREENHYLQDDKSALKNFIQKLQNSYDEVMKQFLDTKNKVESILSQVEKLDGDIIALKSENENLKKENSDINKQLNANSDNLDDVYNKLDLSRIELSDKEAQLKSLESNFNDYKSRGETLSAELDNLRSEVENINKHCNTELRTMEEKDKELSAVKDELDQRDQNWNQLKKESDSLKQGIKVLENDNTVLSNQLKRVDSVINKLQVENDSLKLKIKAFDRELKSDEIDGGVVQKTQESMKRSMNLETGKSERESTHLKSDYTQTDVDVSSNTLQENLNVLKDNAVKLKEKIETRNIDDDQLDKELNKMKNHLENIELKSNQTLKLNEELMGKIKTMNTETASLDRKIAGLQADKNRNTGSLKDSSKHDRFQENFNALRDSVVNLKEKIETRNIDNDQLHRELNKLRNHLENLELKSNQTMKLNEELMDKIKTIKNETAGLDRKIVGLLTDKSKNIESNRDTLSEHDGLQEKSKLEMLELNKRDTDDFVATKNNDGDFSTNKSSREVKSKVLSDKVDVVLTDQLAKDFEAQQKEMDSLRLEKMTLQDNLKKAENDLRKYKNENRNLKDEISKKVDAPLFRVEKTYEDHDNVKSEKAMIRKTKLNDQVLNTSKSFKQKSNGKSLLDNENINELLDFICRRMIKQIEGSMIF